MDPDPIIRRLARTAVVVCALMTVGALWLGGVRAAAGVVGGGLLIGITFVALGSSTAALEAIVSGEVSRQDKRRIAGAALVKLVARYALLGFLAYVMIARLRLHPLGLLAGASSVVAAAGVEAARVLGNPGSGPRR